MFDIVTEVPGDRDVGDHLVVGIHRHRGLQIAPPDGFGSSGVVGTDIVARDAGGVDRGDRDHLFPDIEEVDQRYSNTISGYTDRILRRNF